MSSEAIHLSTTLSHERDAIAAFVGVLQREQQACVQGDVSLLLPLAEEKSKQVERLTVLGEERNRFVAALGYPLDRPGIERCFSEQSVNTKVWQEILELAETARTLNQTNGMLINERLRYNQQALAVLQAAAGNASLYGPDGQTQSISTGRPLGAG